MGDPVDEYGIPIKRKQQPQVDEFGIPIKKKEAGLRLPGTTSLDLSYALGSGGQSTSIEEDDDPVKSVTKPLLEASSKAYTDYTQYGNQRRNVSESTKQASYGSREMINKAADYQHQLQKDFDNTTEALHNKTNEVVQKVLPNGKAAIEYLQKKVQKNNGKLPEDNTTVNIAVDKANRFLSLKEKFDNGKPIEQVSLETFMENNPEVAKRYSVIKGEGLDLPEVMKGKIEKQFLDDPDVQEILKDNPEYERLRSGEIYAKYPELAENEVRNRMSREYEKRKANIIINPVFNKSKYLDNLADELFANEPYLKIVADRFKGAWEDKIHTTAILDNIAHSAGSTYKGMGASIKDMFGFGDSEGKRLRNILEQQYGAVTDEAKGVKKIIGEASDFGGMLLAMGSAGTPGALLKMNPAAVNAAITGATFYDQELNNWTNKFPGEPNKAKIGAGLSTALFMAAHKIFPSGQITKNVVEKMQPEIATILKNTEGSVVSKELEKTLADKFYNVAKEAGGRVATGTTHMMAITAAQDAIGQVMGAKPLADEDYVDVAKSMVIGLTFPEVMKAASNRNVVSNTLNSIATFPDRYKNVLENARVTNPEMERDILKKIQDIDFLKATKEQLIEKGVPEKNQPRYLLEAMGEKYANEKIKKGVEPTIEKQEKEKLKEHQEIKEGILRGEDPENIITEAQQKKIDERQKAKDEIESLEKKRELDNKELSEKRKELDGRRPEDRIKIEKLELQKEEKNKEYDKKVADQEKVIKPQPQEQKPSTVSGRFKFPLPEKPVDEMSAKELDDYIGVVSKYEKESKLTKEQEEKLTKDEADDYFGKNLPKEGVYDKTELQRIYNRVSGIEQAETAKEISEYIKRPLIDYARKKDTENLAVIKAAKRRADELGIDIIPEVENVLKAEFGDNAPMMTKEIFSQIEQKPSTVTELQKPEVNEANQPDISYDDFVKEANAYAQSMPKEKRGFDWVLDTGRSGLVQKDIEGAISDIENGKQTKRRERYEKELKAMHDSGVIRISRGTGANVQSMEIPLKDWMAEPLDSKEIDAAVNIAPELVSEINENGITLNNIDNFKHLFNGFPFDQSDLQSVKDYLAADKSNAASKNIGEKSQASEEKIVDEKVEQPASESPQPIPTKESIQPKEGAIEAGEGAEKPPKPPEKQEPVGEEGEGGKNKSLANRLVGAKNVPEAAKQGIRERGLKYEPKSQEEAQSIAKEIINTEGLESAVLQAQAGKFGGDVNTLVQTEALNQLAELSEKETDKAKKLQYDQKFAEIAIELDEWLRDKAGRGVAALNLFYKKSPLGVVLVENAKRKQEFDNWAKPKDKSWKQVFDELVKEPEFEKLFIEKVKEELKKERSEARKARVRKVDEFFNKAKKDIEGKGGAVYSTIIPPKIISAALDGMQKAYHAGEEVVELIEEAVAYISDKLGHENWDKEKFRKEWRGKLKEKIIKEPPTDEELKARVLEKFRNKLKGLSEQQKDDVIRKAHRKLIDSGALEYDDFRNIIARVTGRGELSESEATKLKELVKKTNELDDIAKAARTDRTLEALERFKKAEIETAKASRELNELFYNKPDITKRLTSIMQLNTLGIPALINNPIYNVWNQALLRFPIGVINDVIDRGISAAAKIMGKNYQREYNVFETQKEFWRMLGVGAKESATQVATGLNRADYTQKELYTEQIRPIRAIKDLIAYSKGKKQLTNAQVIDKALQGFPLTGMSAEIVARLLNIGDKPQRFAAEGAQASAFAKAVGLKDMDYKLFVEFPREEAYRVYKAQGYSDAEAGQKADYIRDVIIKEGQRSTFQQDNLLNDALTAFFGRFFGGKDTGAAALAKSLTISPYVKIPSNAFWSMYNLLNPEVAMAQAAVHGYRSRQASNKGEGNKSKMQLREARYWMAHAMVGIATRAVVIALVNQGIFTPSKDDSDSKKERDATNYFERAGTVKVDGLNISNRWFGQIGMLANQISKKYYEATPEQREKQDDFWNVMFGGMEIEGLKELQNGVFSNSSSMLQAFDSGNFDRYLTNTLSLFNNIIQPATFAQINRAALDEVPSSRGDGLLDQINQNLAQRNWLYRYATGTEINKKRDIWGQTIPKGGNVISRMFGISKANPQVFARPIYDDFLKTGDTGFLPPAVLPTLNGQKLNTEQYNRLQEYVGAERKRRIEPYINDMAVIPGYDEIYSKLPDNIKKERLAYLYDLGRDAGLDRFYSDYPDFKPIKTVEDRKEEQIKEKSNFRLKRNFR